jgi:hypothetical protein
MERNATGRHNFTQLDTPNLLIFMTDNTTIIGTFGTLVAASSLVLNQVQEFDIYLKFGVSCIGLLTAILTAVYVGLKLWHGTYKKE